ncbi:hypothetical protein THASP1DRAFT_25384, partial [Thamnocephalis sphaerospora]
EEAMSEAAGGNGGSTDGMPLFLTLAAPTRPTRIKLVDCSLSPLGAEQLAKYLASPAYANKGCGSSSGDSAAEHLGLGVSANYSLQELDCSRSQLGNKFVYACCRGFREKRLQRLHRMLLRENRINDGGVVALCNVLTGGSTDQLRCVDLAGNQVTAFGVQLLADAIEQGVPLVDLDLSGNAIVPSAITTLCQTIARVNASADAPVRFLRLAANDLAWSTAGVRTLCDWIRSPNCPLVALELCGAQLGDLELRYLAIALSMQLEQRR